MAGVPGEGDRSATSGGLDPETSDLIAHIRELTVDDPQAVQQVVAEVLAALDRVTGVAFRDGPADESPLAGGYDEPPVSVADLEARAAEVRSGDPAPGSRPTSTT